MENLETIAEAIREELEAKNAARDDALARSRELIRQCANTIKLVHRDKWDEAQNGLETVRNAAQELTNVVDGYPDLYHSGYTQDALKEYVEAFATYALVRGELLPTQQDLGVPGSTYLNGLAEAASELRRNALDIIRHDHNDKAELRLEQMDTIYNVLMTFDFPDAITYGLRRRVDSLRGVVQRTRGDLTNSLRQQRLQVALLNLEDRLSDILGDPDTESQVLDKKAAMRNRSSQQQAVLISAKGIEGYLTCQRAWWLSDVLVHHPGQEVVMAWQMIETRRNLARGLLIAGSVLILAAVLLLILSSLAS